MLGNYGLKKKSVPVIFEPPCIYSNISVIVDEGWYVRCCLFSDQGVQKFIELSMTFRSSGTQCFLAGLVLPSISEEHSAFRMLWSTDSVTQHYIPKDLNPQQHQCENLQCCTIKLVSMFIHQLIQELHGHLHILFHELPLWCFVYVSDNRQMISSSCRKSAQM